MVLSTQRGTIIRQRVDDFSVQSRTATGFLIQKIDRDDAITMVDVLPPAAAETDETGEERYGGAQEEGSGTADPEGLADSAFVEFGEDGNLIADIETSDTATTVVSAVEAVEATTVEAVTPNKKGRATSQKAPPKSAAVE